MPADRYDDGIPRVWQGQPVIRWDEALARRLTLSDTTPFLAAAWLYAPVGIIHCPKDGCHFGFWADEPGRPRSSEEGAVARALPAYQMTTGPKIVRVHGHDPQTGKCSEAVATCLKMLVVDAVLWSGDGYTEPHPLSVATALEVITSIAPDSRLQKPGPDVWGCSANLPDGLTSCPAPTGSDPRSQVAGFVVMPSAPALARALPTIASGVAGCLAAPIISSESGFDPDTSWHWDDRWLVVENVALVVRTQAGGFSEADRQLLDQLVSALQVRARA